MSNQPVGRGASSLTQGTKIALTLAACSLAVAVYYYTAKTHFVGHDGAIFGCGSPMSPNKFALAKGQCGILEGVYFHRALLFLALALILAVLGFFLFGAPRDGAVRDAGDTEEDDVFATRSRRRGRLGDEDLAVTDARAETPVTSNDEVVESRRAARRLDGDVTDEAPTRRRLARLDDEA